MEKYSIKCGRFILDHKLLPVHYPSKNTEVVDKFFILFENVEKEKFDIKKRKLRVARILRDDEYPVIYQIVMKLFSNGSLVKYLVNLKEREINELYNILSSNNFDAFLKWYHLYHGDIGPFNFKDQAIIDISEKIFRDNDPGMMINRMVFDNPFVPIEIQRLVEVKDLDYTQCQYGSVTINIYNQHGQHDSIDIVRLFKIVSVMTKVANYSNGIEINIFSSQMMKSIGEKGDILCPIHVNSGSTLKKFYVNIWRSEEIEKVLIHELIHYLSLDFDIFETGYQKVDRYLNGTFNVKGEVYLNEGYTEALAQIIHTCWVAHNLDMRHKFWELLNLEINFGIFQCAKLLDHFEFSELNEIFSSKQTSKKIKQKTDIFSYFFIRVALLTNLEQFLFFINKDVHFNRRFDDFINLVDRSIKSHTFAEYVDKYLALFKNRDQKQESSFIDTTLRMSCLQINQKRE